MIRFIQFSRKTSLILAILTFVVLGVGNAAEAVTPYESMLLIRERNLRDLERAKELRGKAMLQKSRLQTIVEKAKRGAQDPKLDKETLNKILEGAPAGIQNAKKTLTETERAIKNIQMNLEWIERAINNSGNALKPNKGYNPVGDVGFGMVLQPTFANVQLLRPGHKNTIPLGQEKFLPGDEIVSDKLGHTAVTSLGSENYVIVVGPVTRLKLEQDDKKKGTIWSLSQGVVHYAPLGANAAAGPALLRTPDSIVQGSPDSEYDVRVNDKGETSVEVYQGRVEVQEPNKGVSYFVDAKTNKPTTTRWWEKK